MPSVNVSPQVMPHCALTPVDDTSAGCIDSVLHDINDARSLEGLGPMVLPTDYATDPVPVQQLVIADEERGDRGLSQFSGLDPALNTVALTGAVGNADPVPPGTYHDNAWGSNFALDYTPLGADFAWMYDDGYGGTNAECTAPSDANCWGHRDNILGAWTTTGSQTAQMGDADTSTGQYTQLFADQQNPPDTDIDPVTPGALPTPTTAAPPDVVQVMPASSSSVAAGTPVTIEGNYFDTMATPQVFFGGMAATNVHVNWDGELSADAPADPAGTARDQVVVTVSTTAGTSSSSGTAQVNEFTYAPTTAPTVTSVSPASGPEIPSGSVTIHGTNFVNGGVAPIVDFGTVASIGSMTYSGTSITTTIPPSIDPGLVNITVTTPAGTSAVSAADQYTYTGSGSTTAPGITSADHATFSAGSASVFTITTTGTPGVSSLTDTAFSGCTPSTLPASVGLNYTGGTTATLDGTPQPGDGGTFTICLVAANGTAPVATQAFALTVEAPAVAPPSARTAAARRAARLLAGRVRRRHLHLRLRPVLRFDGVDPSAAPRGGHDADCQPRWLLVGRFRRRDLRLRQRRLLRLDPWQWARARRLGPPAQPERSHCGHGPSSDGGGYFMVASDGGCSPSATRGSRARVRASAAATAPPWPWCPTPAATATGS